MPLDDLSDLPEEALLARYATGDRMAARVLVLRLSPRLLSYVYRLLRDRAEAEDVVQEALLRLLGEPAPLNLICAHRAQLSKSVHLLREFVQARCAQLLRRAPWRV